MYVRVPELRPCVYLPGGSLHVVKTRVASSKTTMMSDLEPFPVLFASTSMQSDRLDRHLATVCERTLIDVAKASSRDRNVGARGPVDGLCHVDATVSQEMRHDITDTLDRD